MMTLLMVNSFCFPLTMLLLSVFWKVAGPMARSCRACGSQKGVRCRALMARTPFTFSSCACSGSYGPKC